MRLDELFALFGGILTEIALLYGERPSKKVEGEADSASTLFAALTYEQRVLIFGGAALLISLFFNQFEFGRIYLGWLYGASNFGIAALLCLVLFSAVLGERMLPRVNEQQMLIIHLIVGVNLFVNDTLALPGWGLALLLVPTAALLFQAVWPRPLPLPLRAFYYLWYLVTILMLAFQNGAGWYFEAFDLTMLEVFVIGSILVFLALHFLVALRFVLITSSLILPRNRPLLRLVMPRLMRDEQMSSLALVSILGVTGLIWFANRRWGLVLDQMLVNVAVLIILQAPWKMLPLKEHAALQ